MGYDGEDAEDTMAYNTCARIEMAKPRALKSVPRPRPSCVAQFQAYVLPQLKSRMSSRKQRCERHSMLQPVLTAAVQAAQVNQDRAADAVHQTPQPKISKARAKESAVPIQSRGAELRMSQPSSPSASKHLKRSNIGRFGTSDENKNSEGWEEDMRSRVRTATESIEETLQRLSAELDAELQEVDMLSAELAARLQVVDMDADATLEELQKQNFSFSETYVEIGQRETETTISWPVEPNKSGVPVEPSRSRVPGRWPRQAVASRSRVMRRSSWQSGLIPKHYNTPKVQPTQKPPPEINKTICNPKKAQGSWH